MELTSHTNPTHGAHFYQFNGPKYGESSSCIQLAHLKTGEQGPMKGSHSSPPSIQNTTCCATRNTSVLLVRNRPPQFGFLQKNLKTKHDKTASHRIIWSYMFLPVPKPNPSHSTGCPAEAPVPLSMVMALAASSADEKATPAVPLPRPLKHSTQVVLPASPQFRNPWRVAELKQTMLSFPRKKWDFSNKTWNVKARV